MGFDSFLKIKMSFRHLLEVESKSWSIIQFHFYCSVKYSYSLYSIHDWKQ